MQNPPGDDVHKVFDSAEKRQPSIIDEWQDTPILWDAMRNAVDELELKGQFILTGSPLIEAARESIDADVHQPGRISPMTRITSNTIPYWPV